MSFAEIIDFDDKEGLIVAMEMAETVLAKIENEIYTI